ncbi:hypothetical protein [Flavobacterium sp. IMCC34518]|uniref:hypothetical protein n=1 Tax=Flavobacterium sp. IMCC34518 TaxID=3003623 RepID=UPI002482EE7F|nr:hypothetical protein [Flavobacterium sp. IMCC34518]
MKKSAIENQFKKKLSSREIMPSSVSWDRLDAMLTIVEKPKRNFKWMYVAASLLGFLLIGSIYFNQNQDEVVFKKNDIVVTDSKTVPEVKSISKPLTSSKRINLKSSFSVPSEVIKKLPKENENIVFENTDNQFEQKATNQEQQISIINQKTEQKNVLRKSKYVNVDELLASVDSFSKNENTEVFQSNVKVDSKELLSQVDGELELSFREKALKVVNKKIKMATVALSNRNSE